jgi:hypothetical protein
VQHRHAAVVKRREPAAPSGLGPRELFLSRVQCHGLAARGIDPVEVPPAGARQGDQQLPGRGPLDLGHRVARSAEQRAGVPEDSVLPDLGDLQLRGVPGHVGVIPGQPDGRAAVGRDLGPGDEAVPVVRELPHRHPVFGRRTVERHRGDEAVDVLRSLAGELLHRAADDPSREIDHGLGPVQTVAHRGGRRQGPRPRAGDIGFIDVQPLVREVNEDDQRAVLTAHAVPRPVAVFEEPGAQVPRCRQRAFDAAVGPAPEQVAAARLLRACLLPPHLLPDDADRERRRDLADAHLGGGRDRGERRDPRSVGAGDDRQRLTSLRHRAHTPAKTAVE